MYAYDDHRATKIALSFFFLFVVGYAYFELRGLLFGPSITFKDHPADTANKFVEVEGSAERIQTLTMNGAPVEVTERGEFKEPYLLAPGSNRIVFEAKDKYGNATDAYYDIYLVATGTVSTSTLPAIPVAGTSTMATSSTATSSALSTSTIE